MGQPHTERAGSPVPLSRPPRPLAPPFAVRLSKDRAAVGPPQEGARRSVASLVPLSSYLVPSLAPPRGQRRDRLRAYDV
jgi:hypothetical protein